MCGIFGFASFGNESHFSIDKCRASLTLLKHRGPDAEGEYCDRQVYLGHRRLSIIDLSDAARQPFVSNSQNSIITFNGEIYNYRSLAKGLNLRSKSDTEVLLEGYEKYGYPFFLRLKGMYAFCIYDKKLNKVIIYRDPAGIKPLYYRDNEFSVSCASEIKALFSLDKLHLSTNEEALKSFICRGYVPEPLTIYKEIKALEPGTLMEWDIETGHREIYILNQYSYNFENAHSFAENCEQTDFLLQKASARNQVADVEVNTALSGGIDSSLLNYYSRNFRKGKSITIRFTEDSYNEVPTASLFAKHLGVQHVISEVNPTGQLDLLNKLLVHFDQPYADSSLIPFFFLCKTGSQYSKVLVGGDGGDELHNGYFTQRVFPSLSGLISNSKIQGLTSMLMAVRPLLPVNYARLFLKFNNVLNTPDRSALLFHLLSWFPLSTNQYPINPFLFKPEEVKSFTDDHSLSNTAFVQSILFKERMLSDYLRKADMMSMLNGLEYRVPMLDEDLVSFSLSIPYNQKCSLTESKKVLRKIHSKYFPKGLSELKKKGFSLPLDTWLGSQVLEEMKSYISLKDGIVKDYIDPRYVEILFKTLTERQYGEYCSRESAYQRILILFSLQHWYKRQRI